MAQAFYHGAPGVGQSPVRQSAHNPYSAFMPPLLGAFAALAMGLNGIVTALLLPLLVRLSG